MLSEELIKKEKQLIAKEDAQPILVALIDDEFFELGSSGNFFDKDEVVLWLGTKTQTKREGFDFKALQITEDSVLITYYTRIQNNPTEPEQTAFRSSIWRKKEGVWKMLFHQATPQK